MFKELEQINSRPEPWEFYTADDLWTDAHTSKQMLAYHLDDSVDLSSRNSAFIDRSVEWIVSRFDVVSDFKIADFGCGPGLYASRLAKRKAAVTGIDFSPTSIGYARDAAKRDGLSIRYVNQNYLEYETDQRFQLIMMIFCDFCVLSPVQRRRMLDKFQTLLAPGGSVLLDVQSLAAFGQRAEGSTYEINLLNGFWSPGTYHGFLNTFRYEEEKLVLDKYTIIDADRTRTVYNWFQYFSRESLEREFEEAGFTVESVHGDVAGSPFDRSAEEFAVVAGRSGQRK